MGDSCSIEQICEAQKQTGATRRRNLSSDQGIKFTQKDLVKIKKYEISKDYIILTPAIGKGSFGSVYKVVNRLSGVEWAAKKIPLNPKISKHLQQIYILKQLDHPNVVRIIDIYEEQKFIYVVMEYCGGGELFDRITQRKKMNEQTAKNFMYQLLSAISYCHKNKIIHRDLKPQNIMLISNKEDNIKIIDFGAGTFYHEGQTNTAKVGSVYYIAPQVIKKSYNEKCDIWSLGVIMYMMLSGQPPFNGKTDKAIFDKILKGQYTFPTKKWKNISKQAKNLIQLMMQYNPEQRISARQAMNHPWFNKDFSNSDDIFLTNQLHSIQQFCKMNKFKQFIVMYVAHNLSTASSLENMLKQFKKIDKNNDGVISWREFDLCYRETMPESDPRTIKQIFKRLDKNQSGYIDYSELMTSMMSSQLTENLKLVNKAFDLIDKNQDNQLDRKQLSVALGGLEQSLYQQIINEIDTNNDGFISRQQFINAIMSVSNEKIKNSRIRETRAETKQI